MIYIIITIIVVLILIAAFITYKMAFYSPVGKQNDLYNLPSGSQYLPYNEIMKSMIDNIASIEYEEVEIKSFDGLKLKGKYYHVCDGAPLAICFHGYRSNAVRDFSGGAVSLMNSSHNVLLVDERGQGESQGHTITFGIKERKDCLKWCEYSIERFGKDTKIILYGISMGGATVLMASELDLPKNVVGIAADCPYSSPKEIICHVLKHMKLPATLLYPILWLGALIFGGFMLNSATAVDAVKNAKVPIMIIHGEADKFVPCDMSRKIYAANNKIKLYTFKNAAHGMSYVVDKQRYESLISEFEKEL